MPNSRVVAVFDNLDEQLSDLVVSVLQDTVMAIHQGYVSVDASQAPSQILIADLTALKGCYEKDRDPSSAANLKLMLRILGVSE